MKGRRVFIILMVNILAVLALSVVLAATAWAAEKPEQATELAAPNTRPEALATGTLSMTILNIDEDRAQNISAYYDHNANNPDYVAGLYVGARVCATSGFVDDVEATLSGFQPYDAGLLNTNVFMMGRNEAVTRALGTLTAPECALAYYYVMTPNQKNVVPAPAGLTNAFTISTTGTDAVLVSDSNTVQMFQAIQASPNKVNNVISTSNESLFTMTVFYELGNAGNPENDVSFQPTGWISHDAGFFDLIAVHMTNPENNIDSRDLLHIEDILGSGNAGTITYTFKRVTTGNTTFFPLDIVSSGTQDKYNSDVTSSGTPTAITLGDLRIGTNEPPVALLIGAVAILVLATVIILQTGRQHRKT